MAATPHMRGHYRRVHRYSSARRDRIRILVMLLVGGGVIAGLLFLILTK
jgi:hypothetical protein